MLVLTRNIRESLYIDGPCIITLDRVKGTEVRLSFNAPDSTKIVRTEILNQQDTEEMWRVVGA